MLLDKYVEAVKAEIIEAAGETARVAVTELSPVAQGVIQVMLRGADYYRGKIDNKAEELTQEALGKFKAVVGLVGDEVEEAGAVSLDLIDRLQAQAAGKGEEDQAADDGAKLPSNEQL